MGDEDDEELRLIRGRVAWGWAAVEKWSKADEKGAMRSLRRYAMTEEQYIFHSLLLFDVVVDDCSITEKKRLVMYRTIRS